MTITFSLLRFCSYLLGSPNGTAAVFSDKWIGSIRIEKIKLRHQDIGFYVNYS